MLEVADRVERLELPQQEPRPLELRGRRGGACSLSPAPPDAHHLSEQRRSGALLFRARARPCRDAPREEQQLGRSATLPFGGQLPSRKA